MVELKKWVVLTNYLGIYWVDDKGAQATRLALASPTPIALVFGKEVIKSNTVQAVVSKDKYLDICWHGRDKSWSCQYGGRHSLRESCNCLEQSKISYKPVDELE